MDVDGGDEDVPLSSKGRKHTFFQRSDSTLFLGCPPPDPFNYPLSESLLLADQPHLLQPTSRKEDLFGLPRSSFSASSDPPPASSDYQGYGDFETAPTKLGLSVRTADTHRTTVPSRLPPLPSSLRHSQNPPSEEEPRASRDESYSGFEGASQEYPISMTTSGSRPSESTSAGADYDASADGFSGTRGVAESPRAPIIVAAPGKKQEDVSPVKSSVIVHAGCIRQPSSAVSLFPLKEPLGIF